jgi:hypothetical protein
VTGTAPRRNRAMPDGRIVADPARGLFMGNRGCLHDAAGRPGPALWRGRRWICCVTAFRGRRRVPMTPGRYTELFFLDEAVALAAGHRPCAECRRADFDRFRAAWAAAFGGAPPGAAGIDAALHAARLDGRAWRRHAAAAAALPEGAFLCRDGQAWVVAGGAMRPFAPAGYGAARPLPDGPAEVLTPALTVAVLAAGYRPVLHPTAAG